MEKPKRKKRTQKYKRDENYVRKEEMKRLRKLMDDDGGHATWSGGRLQNE